VTGAFTSGELALRRGQKDGAAFKAKGAERRSSGPPIGSLGQ